MNSSTRVRQEAHPVRGTIGSVVKLELLMVGSGRYMNTWSTLAIVTAVLGVMLLLWIRRR
jgi:uncharacterized membrane protein YeaQ/YmgE (transglycosylase-associated protein family)